MSMDTVDCVVVGAGVVGLAVARALAQAGQEVLVLEAAETIGTGVSSRNSEVIHAGMYYTPGSRKAQWCVQGRHLLYEFCAQHGVGHQRCGKLIVATSPEQHGALQTIAQRAQANGVDDLQWLSAAQAQAMEPELRCEAALWSPSTGIVDSHGLMLALQGSLEASGGVVALNSRLTLVEWAPDAIDLVVSSPDGSETRLRSRVLVNAAGLWAPWVAARVQGGALSYHLPKARFAKGSYYALTGRAPFSRLVYPAPQDAWLGVHLTLDLGGQARFGPDLQWLDIPSADEIDYRVDPERAQGFYAEVRRYWPALPDGALVPAYSGVRPKIHGPDQPAPDFRVDGPAEHGMAGVVHLLGIESPGLTSSLAIAEHVRELLRQD